ncbi:MAG: hypothetical protein HY000_13860 [Planctomycetes bacterium]|nr:hypothetical protein [Planctomycetota bacterium]
MRYLGVVAVAFLALALVVGSSAQERISPTWEYKVIYALEQDEGLTALLNQHSRANWELVTAHESVGNGVRLYLKRPKQS